MQTLHSAFPLPNRKLRIADAVDLDDKIQFQAEPGLWIIIHTPGVRLELHHERWPSVSLKRSDTKLKLESEQVIIVGDRDMKELVHIADVTSSELCTVWAGRAIKRVVRIVIMLNGEKP